MREAAPPGAPKKAAPQVSWRVAENLPFYLILSLVAWALSILLNLLF